ncbi:MAG TPA: nitronate monooxygenase [Solirubrobacteraceae bacterium]|nr:nitronate monooxygenase [Solirubrobacteraceae bacterium]
MRVDLTQLGLPIIQAPLAGGPSTPRLAAAVSEVGAFGFLAAGYKAPDTVRDDIRDLRALTDAPFGLNIFAPPAPADSAALERYATTLAADAERYGVALGEPRHDDDAFEGKVRLAADEAIAVVSFTFGCPSPGIVRRLHDADADVWVTVTSPAEAREAQEAGADALVVQGFEAGGHRGYFIDDPGAEDYGLIALLRLVADRVALPLIGAGGIADGAALAAVLCAGAVAGQIGSALMLAAEAGTSAAHRAALRTGGSTALTRAFSGRQARGIVNRFMREHGDDAPIAYPDVHHLTAPLRAAARTAADPEAVNLWAGQGYTLAAQAPAAEIVTRIAADARSTLAAVGARLGGGQQA